MTYKEIQKLVREMEREKLNLWAVDMWVRKTTFKYAARAGLVICLVMLGIILAFLFVPLDIDFSYTVSWGESEGV